MEIFKDIKGYEGTYQVSNHGRVKRLAHEIDTESGKHLVYPEEIKSQAYNKKINRPYMQVWIGNPNTGRKRCYTHRLVAEAFVEKPQSDDKLEVNHEDGNKFNNRADNLTWVTRKQNMEHASKTGLINRHSEKRKIQCAKNSRKGAPKSYLKQVEYDIEGNFLRVIKNSKEVSQGGGKRSFTRFGRIYRDYNELMFRYGEIPKVIRFDKNIVLGGNTVHKTVVKIDNGEVVGTYPSINDAPITREKLIFCYNHRTFDNNGFLWDIV